MYGKVIGSLLPVGEKGVTVSNKRQTPERETFWKRQSSNGPLQDL